MAGEPPQWISALIEEEEPKALSLCHPTTAGTWLSANQESLTENPTMLAPESQTSSPQNWERERPVV